MIKEYITCKLNAVVLSHKIINTVTLQEQMIIELDESPLTGYCWYFNVSDPSILKLNYKETFDFNKPNVIGGSQQIIWAFRCLRRGECRIQFAYYKSWKGERTSLYEYTYIVKVE